MSGETPARCLARWPEAEADAPRRFCHVVAELADGRWLAGCAARASRRGEVVPAADERKGPVPCPRRLLIALPRRTIFEAPPRHAFPGIPDTPDSHG
jgi:hypothetical protein